MHNRIGLRIAALKALPADIAPDLAMKAQIELRALRLLNLQTQVGPCPLASVDAMLTMGLHECACRCAARSSRN